MKSISSAAKEIGLPKRTLYSYIERGIVPCESVPVVRLMMTTRQIQLVKRVLATSGRRGLRKGLALI